MTNIIINNSDLYKKTYKIHDLERNIMNLSNTTIINTQKLNAEFIAKYILNDDYYEGYEDNDKITEKYILKRQPHISIEELHLAIKNTKGAYYY